MWCLLVLAAAAPTQRASAAVLEPRNDPFYQAPARLDHVANGTILRVRKVDVSLVVLPISGLRATTYQLLYRTEDNDNRPTANVATVIVPQGTSLQKPRGLVSLQDAEDSLDWDCAPSYQLRVGENAPTGEMDGNLVAELAATALPELAAGRVLVIPDVEGPTSDYVVRRSDAHMVLDAIRASERFAPAGLQRSAPVAMVGYSGGGWESAVANELQPSYAPELNVVAVAAGGVPVANLANVRYIDGGVATGVLMAVADRIARAYHVESTLVSALTAAGRAFLKKVRTGCATSVFAAPFAHFNQWTTKPNFFGRADIQRIIADNELGHGVPKAPTFYYNGVQDEIIWVEPLDGLVAEYCAAGAPILYVRDHAGLEHIQGAGNFFALARAYVEARFAGAPVPSSCGVPPYNSVPPE